MKLKIAIIGGGPSSFYCASRILSKIPYSSPRGNDVQVHIYDRLWAPHGLVRYGVAPDHPEVKNCTNKFDETAKDPRFRFFGNVNVGSVESFDHTLHLPLEKLRPFYTHLIISHGASLPLILPALGTSAIPALSIVHWYTGHPSNPVRPPLEKAKHMALIGHGNVSLDIARILFSNSSRLAPLDIPHSVLGTLAASSLEHISIVSRRGPAQVSFTAKEIRELLTLPGVSMRPIQKDLLTPPPNATRQQLRILDLLRKGSTEKYGTTKKSWSLDFFLTPKEHANGRLHFMVNTLDAESRAVPTGDTQEMETDLVVGSVGYRSEPVVPDWFDGGLGRMRQKGAVILDQTGKEVSGVYTSGWAANGAKGVLATTMMDAYSVVERLLEESLVSTDVTECHPGIPDALLSPKHRVVSYEDWKRVDENETKRGALVGKERERMSWSEVNDFL